MSLVYLPSLLLLCGPANDQGDVMRLAKGVLAMCKSFKKTKP
jgi:hypothetical protein